MVKGLMTDLSFDPGIFRKQATTKNNNNIENDLILLLLVRNNTPPAPIFPLVIAILFIPDMEGVSAAIALRIKPPTLNPKAISKAPKIYSSKTK